MKVYVVNVNNCEAYSDYYEGNRGVYATEAAALRDLEAMGFDLSTKHHRVPWAHLTKEEIEKGEWIDEALYNEEAFRIEEWEVIT